MENVGKYAKDNQIYKWEVVNLKRIKGSMALVFKMRLIRKNDINENWSTSQSMSTGSEGCLVVMRVRSLVRQNFSYTNIFQINTIPVQNKGLGDC